MKTFYALLLALVLGMTVTGQAYAAQNGGQVGGQHQSNGSEYAGGGNGAGDMLRLHTQDCDNAGDCDGDQLRQRLRDQDCDGTGTGDCDVDRDRVQQRDRDQDCDGAGTGDCDGDQLQQRDRVHQTDPQYTQTQNTEARVARLQQLLQQLRGMFARMYGGQQ